MSGYEDGDQSGTHAGSRHKDNRRPFRTQPITPERQQAATAGMIRSAVEFGYKAHERGLSLEKTLAELGELFK